MAVPAAARAACRSYKSPRFLRVSVLALPGGQHNPALLPDPAAAAPDRQKAGPPIF